MPKLPLVKVAALDPAFFESFRYSYGSYAEAGRRLKIDPDVLRRAAKGAQISDTNLPRIQRAIKRANKVHYDAANQYVFARAGATPAQLDFAKRYSARSETGQKYFRKVVRDYKRTHQFRMPALEVTEEGKRVVKPFYVKKRATRKKRQSRAFRRRRR